jgi:dimethylhistidine N-methyltransferase
MSQAAPSVELHDFGPVRAQLLCDALEGLAAKPKFLPCKYFYDERGSALFERICELEEYYPTRTEIGIMERYGKEMAETLGPRCLVVEYGIGSSRKARVLLDHLEQPAGYVPVDISREHLVQAAQEISAQHPVLPVLPVCADFTAQFELPEPEAPAARNVAYFPGSTIGNFAPEDAAAFLRRIAAQCGVGGGLLIGVDLKKDPRRIERAYNDTAGVTADFNLNLLHRLNEELGADFELDAFEHRAFYDREAGRIEMHLVSLEEQVVTLSDTRVSFSEGETIHTESSYKYALPEFATLAGDAGFRVEHVWTDESALFSVQFLAVV